MTMGSRSAGSCARVRVLAASIARAAATARAVAGAGLLCCVAVPRGGGQAARAAELNVISAGAVRGVIAGMIDYYGRQTGHTFKFTVGSTGQLREVITSGEPADLIIASAPLMAELDKTGRM